MENYAKIAGKMISTIKADFESAKERCKAPAYQLNLEVWSRKEGGKEGFVIKENGSKDLTPFINYQFQVIGVFDEFVKQLKALSTHKAWKGLTYDTKEYPNSRNWTYPCIISLIAEPCKEFVSLQKYLAKYCGITIGDTDCYRVCIGGKRGRIYGEDGERRYICHEPIYCKSILEKLRIARGARDKANGAIKMQDNIDDWVLRNSIYNETEFSGTRCRQCVVTIQTPSGKIKAEITI